jgi:dTDP-4-amino-4,6-dideoxygalactose transaminase
MDEPGLKLRTAIPRAAYPGASLIDDEEAAAVARVMRSRSLFRYYGLSEPREVAAYEEEWAARIGRRHALAVNSGTSALFCALVAAGVGPGDEVVLPAFAWASVPNAILQAGGVPVIVDVDATLTIDVEAVERAITPRTRAILPVHMRGAACAMDELSGVATAAGVAIVEDACQAAGVTYRGRPAGSFGRLAAFSTQYAKLVATGEGGVLVTDDAAAYRAALDAHDPANALRRGEQPSAYPGLNLRCTELQAAVGRVQLGRLDGLVERTRSLARRLSATIERIPALELRGFHDRDGANGVAVIFYAPSAGAAGTIRDELVRESVSASLLFDPGVPDLHVARWWLPAHDALRRAGGPASAWQPTTDRLGRAVQIDLHPLYGDDDLSAICAAVERAAAVV